MAEFSSNCPAPNDGGDRTIASAPVDGSMQRLSGRLPARLCAPGRSLGPAAQVMRFPADFRRGGRGKAKGYSSLLKINIAVSDDPVHFGPTEIGFVVSKQVGNSVVRHRLKRQLRVLIATEVAAVQEALPVGSLIVVRAFPAAAQATSSELKMAVAKAFAQAVAKLPRKCE